MIMSKDLDLQWGSRDKIQGNFPILKISKFDIGLIKMLFCSVAKVEPLVLKMKIWSCFIVLLDCAFRKSYAVTAWPSIIAFKLVEYLVNIHLMVLKKIML